MEIGNFFGLARQYVNGPDLISLMFPGLGSFDDLTFEIIPQEWIEGSAITTSAGAITSNPNYKYAYTDVSDYDYVLIPNSKTGSINAYSGLCQGPGTSIGIRYLIVQSSGTINQSGYCLFEVDSTNIYAAVTELKEYYIPLIGIRKRV